MEELRRFVLVRWHVSERGLHPLQGAARVVRTVPACEGRVRHTRHQAGRHPARPRRHAEAPRHRGQDHDERHQCAVQGQRRHGCAGARPAAAGQQGAGDGARRFREDARGAARGAGLGFDADPAEDRAARRQVHRRFLERTGVRRGTAPSRRHRRRRDRARTRQRVAQARQRGHHTRSAGCVPAHGRPDHREGSSASFQETRPRSQTRRESDPRHGVRRGGGRGVRRRQGRAHPAGGQVGGRGGTPSVHA